MQADGQRRPAQALLRACRGVAGSLASVRSGHWTGGRTLGGAAAETQCGARRYQLPGIYICVCVCVVRCVTRYLVQWLGLSACSPPPTTSGFGWRSRRTAQRRLKRHLLHAIPHCYSLWSKTHQTRVSTVCAGPTPCSRPGAVTPVVPPSWQPASPVKIVMGAALALDGQAALYR